jgi:hypothetical protein
VLRRFVIAMVVTLGLSGLAVLAGDMAIAAPHGMRPPSVQIGYTDSADDRTAYDWAEGVDLPLGARQDESGRTHVSRVYATFDISQLIGKRIYSGGIVIAEADVADCSKRAIEVWSTRTVNKTPSWQTAPKESQKLAEILTTTFCPSDFLSFNVMAAVQDAVAHERTRLTVEIRVPESHESDPSYGRTLRWFRSVALSVQYNTPPTVDPQHRYNGGFPCTASAPYRSLGAFADQLQALGVDADPGEFRLHYEFAVWPQDDPAARITVRDEFGSPDRVGTGRIPAGYLQNGRTYSWQVRVDDGADTSAWSDACSFVLDTIAPAQPLVTSSNYPEEGGGQVGTIGESALFTFSAGDDVDTIGFEYSWIGVSTPGCSFGTLGQLVCRDPFVEPDTVHADAPGGTVTVALTPPGTGPHTLYVRSIDAAGNRSRETTTYRIFVPYPAPLISVVGDEPEWGQTVVLRFAPFPGVTGTVEYDYSLDSAEPQTVPAGPDGTATIQFVASSTSGHQVSVHSHSANGWISPEGGWSVHFDPWPGVRSDVYPANGEPVGGVGVTGTFTFSPPPGMTAIQGYQYAFDGAEFTFVPAGADGRASITWAPEFPEYNVLEVYAVDPDGTWSLYSNQYYFNVAAG